MTKKPLLVMLIPFLLAACLIEAGDSPPDTISIQLEARRQALTVQLLKERATLLRRDPEIAAIHKRIQELYRQLDAALAEKPEIRRIQTQIEAIAQTLDRRRQAPSGQVPDDAGKRSK